MPGRGQDVQDSYELDLIATAFPRHRIWRATTGDRTWYLARDLDLTARPHTIVTDSLAELRAELTVAQRAAAP